eukprot:TRINITY_DN2504_c0_g1_i3.p1 TRINITY_DN2504_c0_g1~~TRINITY_DN2504_c0_g1_i3.p1  ORF type:complete len:152 (+),score=9.45 TRINITY_DN2504_c0_g1_i3:88-543(+)
MMSTGGERRLKKELKDILKRPSPGIVAGPVDWSDLSKWKAAITGPVDTPYEGGVFFVSVKFPRDYPFKPPRIGFTNKVYHPNITEHGLTCLDIEHHQWSPALTITKILEAYRSLLRDPNPDDPLIPDIARQMKCQPEQFAKTAREWTRKYA